jgi:hypothetical protein
MKMAMTGELTTYRNTVRLLFFLERRTVHHIVDYTRLL